MECVWKVAINLFTLTLEQKGKRVGTKKKCFKQNDWGFTGLLTLGALKLLYGGYGNTDYGV